MRMIIIAAILYVLGIFLTYGYYVEREPFNEPMHALDTNKEGVGLCAGAIWPIYWSCKIAKWIFHIEHKAEAP